MLRKLLTAVPGLSAAGTKHVLWVRGSAAPFPRDKGVQIRTKVAQMAKKLVPKAEWTVDWVATASDCRVDLSCSDLEAASLLYTSVSILPFAFSWLHFPFPLTFIMTPAPPFHCY